MAPACGIAAVDENPLRTFLCAPNNKILHDGIFVKLVNPPAMPINLAAVDAPTIIDKFGAINVIRDSTYDKIVCLFSLNFNA